MSQDPQQDPLEDAALESSLESAGQGDPDLDEDDREAELERIEPGAEGPVGTGIEGADDALEADRENDAEREDLDAADYDDEFGQDDSAAAEQGNRDGDEMVSEGEDAREVSELSGDDEDVDVAGNAERDGDQRRLDLGVDEEHRGADLGGSLDGDDPLAGETFS